MVEIKGNCTPQMSILVDYDLNPAGFPVIWLWILDSRSGKKLSVAPLNKQAVNELIVELQKRVSEM